jgi:type IV pilus assembly protein PilW
MNRTAHRHRRPVERLDSGLDGRRGVTLIELMVGMTIGLLATLVVSQVMAFAEGQRRSITSGSDAQVNAALALYTLQREVQMAGYGLSASQTGLGCTIKSVNFTGANGGDRTLAPVVIVDGVSGAPDTLRVLSSGKDSFSVPILVTENHPTSGIGSDSFTVNNSLGVDNGDLMIVVPRVQSSSQTCTVIRANGAHTATSIFHDSGVGDSGAWNGASAGNLLATFPSGGYTAFEGYLVNLGSTLIDRTYSISAGGDLQVVEFDTATASSLAARVLFPQIVNIQALYGKDTSGDGVIDVYDNTTPTTAAGWQQVRAVRVALVARSAQYEKEDVTPTAPSWDLGSTPTVTGSSSCGSSQCISLKVDTDMSSNWKRYRYKVYDTVIPVRNLVWRS